MIKIQDSANVYIKKLENVQCEIFRQRLTFKISMHEEHE